MVINLEEQLLKRKSFQVNCMQEYGVRMSSVWPPSCQIHQTGTAHWIESVQVIIFDSSQGSSPRLSRNLEI